MSTDRGVDVPVLRMITGRGTRLVSRRCHAHLGCGAAPCRAPSPRPNGRRCCSITVPMAQVVMASANPYLCEAKPLENRDELRQTPVPRRAALPPPDTTRRPLGSARPARPRTLPGCGNPQVRVQNDVETVRIPLDNHIQLSRHVPILPSSSESGGILPAEAAPAEHESLTAGRAPASSPWRLDQSSRLVLHGYANSPRRRYAARALCTGRR